MMPPVGCSRRSTIFAVVVLPQPDSPTSPRVLPGSMEKEISSTARTTAIWREKIPRFTGKCLRRFLASRTGPAIVLGDHLVLGSDSQHRLVCASATRNSGGASERQRSMALGQRGWNVQPGGGADGSGGWPALAVSRFRLSPTRGMDSRSARVYGCAGAVEVSLTRPD